MSASRIPVAKFLASLHDRLCSQVPESMNKWNVLEAEHPSAEDHRRNNCRGRGRLVRQLLGWGPTMYWSPNFLAVVFKKQEISQQVVTRMQDKHLSFHKFSGDDTPEPSQREGATPSRTQHPGASVPVLGPKPWSPSTFQPGLRPCRGRRGVGGAYGQGNLSSPAASTGDRAVRFHSTRIVSTLHIEHF